MLPVNELGIFDCHMRHIETGEVVRTLGFTTIGDSIPAVLVDRGAAGNLIPQLYGRLYTIEPRAEYEHLEGETK